MDWQCLSCREQTLSLEVPFGRHGDMPPAELYCLHCQHMTTHEVIGPTTRRYTIGDALTLARVEEGRETSAAAS
ncbi:MAG TPA: hypothetical protein VG817_11495 [Gemmatimonadales bacterium]|nr:hypothetical protein [Gemmatimonadales bacterium]